MLPAYRPNFAEVSHTTRKADPACFRTTFPNSLRVVDRRLIGRKFWGNFGSLPGFVKVITFASFQDDAKDDSGEAMVIYVCQMNQWPSWKVPKAVVFNLFSSRTPRDTFPLNFVPPKLLVHNSSYT
jgi:hypothetical protein